MSRALLQQSVYRMVSDGEPLVGAGRFAEMEGFGIHLVVSESWNTSEPLEQ